MIVFVIFYFNFILFIFIILPYSLFLSKHWSFCLWLWIFSQLLGYGDTLLSLDKLLENPELVNTSEYIPHTDEKMWLRRVDRVYAQELLVGQDDGTFLIRPKENGIYCLSIVWVTTAFSPFFLPLTYLALSPPSPPVDSYPSYDDCLE